MTNENNYDIASKYQVELNSKFTKQGSSSGFISIWFYFYGYI